MDSLKIVVHMMIRNEADIIEETLAEIIRWGLKEIVILDGSSDDGTTEKIMKVAAANIDLYVHPDPGDLFADHRRQELLDLTRAHNPDWILSLDGDEIYDSSPVEAILAAEEAGANVVWSDIPQFWLTIADIRNGLLLEDESMSIQERRKWYSWGHTGVFAWKDLPQHYYPINVQKRTPEFLGEPDFRRWQVPGPIRTICKHYPFRSLRQAMKRAEERRRRGGRKYFGKYFFDWLIDEKIAKLHHFDGEWCKKYNHDKVHQYMGRLGK